MKLLRAVCVVVALAVLGACGCAHPEKKVEKKSKTIRVRAPYTKVDVEIPDDHEEDTKVDVRVRP